MIKFKNNGVQIFCQKICWKWYDGANFSRWNRKVEPSIIWWIVQTEKKKHMQTRGGRKLHVVVKCCWKKVLLSTHVKTSRKKGCWSIINLTNMIETIKFNPLNRLLRQWCLLIWTQCHWKLLGEKLIHILNALLNH
jgi:hypothetical protein